MGRKTIKRTYSDTYAKGEREKISGNRYWINVSLSHIKAESGFKDLGMDRSGEFYFKAGTV